MEEKREPNAALIPRNPVSKSKAMNDVLCAMGWINSINHIDKVRGMSARVLCPWSRMKCCLGSVFGTVAFYALRVFFSSFHYLEFHFSLCLFYRISIILSLLVLIYLMAGYVLIFLFKNRHWNHWILVFLNLFYFVSKIFEILK